MSTKSCRNTKHLSIIVQYRYMIYYIKIFGASYSAQFANALVLNVCTQGDYLVFIKSYWRSSSNFGGNVVESASRHTGPAIHDILLGHDVMGIPESLGLRFDLMRHIDRLM